MENQFSIEKIHQYIDGLLTAEEESYVEKMLAEHEQWRDVYEGLVFANDHDINTKSIVAELEPKLQNKPVTQAALIKRLFPERRWIFAAAGIVAIFILSYGMIYFLNQTTGGFNNTTTSARLPQDFYPEDQISIIPASRTNEYQNQSIDKLELEKVIAQTEDTEIVNPKVGMPVATGLNYQFAEEKERSYSETATNDSELQGANTARRRAEPTANAAPNPYNSLLARYGYREIKNPNLQNTVRGAHIPDFEVAEFRENALSSLEIRNLKQKYETSYFARFPQNGIVQSKLIINQNGEVIDYETLSSPNDEMTKVVYDFATEKIQWNKPIAQNGRPSRQTVFIDVSFGNTVYLSIQFNQHTAHL